MDRDGKFMRDSFVDDGNAMGRFHRPPHSATNNRANQDAVSHRSGFAAASTLSRKDAQRRRYLEAF
jgi:hypothetical protein